MKNIIKINDDIVYVGDKNTGSIIEVRVTDCTFEPTIGDAVEIFSNETCTIVSKAEVIEERKVISTDDRIHINIVNDNSHKNDLSAASFRSNIHVVNKVTYLLLAFFLGGVGAHKFYAGYTTAGILYLLFFWTWIPMLISLIEFVIGCCKASDSQGNILV